MPLGFYGGPTKTHLPEWDSEVIDKGDPSFVSPPVYDQRGRPFDRVFEDGLLDIGAVEYGLGDPNDLPTIIDLIISGSKSIHADYSFNEALAQGIDGFQTVPVGGADTVEVVFSEWVDVDAADLWLYGGYTKIEYTSAWNIVEFDFNTETFTALWRFDDPMDGNTLANPFPADTLFLMIESTYEDYIVDVSGNKLDGEWVTLWRLNQSPPSSFPSGDGIHSGTFFFTFVIMPGDNGLTNTVSGSGFLWWQQHYDPNGTDNTFQDGDFDGDGDVDSADMDLWQASFGLDFTSFWGY